MLLVCERIRAKVICACNFVTQYQQFWSSYFGTLLQDLDLWFSIQIRSSKLGACISFLEGTLVWRLLTMTCLSRGVRLRGYSQPSESFTSCLTWGGRPLVSQLINSLLTRILPVRIQGSTSLVRVVLFQCGQSGMLVGPPACPGGMARLWVNLSLNWVWMKQTECIGLCRAAGWKQWPVTLSPVTAKPEEVALNISTGLI